jgi:hypothetical protein
MKTKTVYPVAAGQQALPEFNVLLERWTRSGTKLEGITKLVQLGAWLGFERRTV